MRARRGLLSRVHRKARQRTARWLEGGLRRLFVRPPYRRRVESRRKRCLSTWKLRRRGDLSGPIDRATRMLGLGDRDFSMRPKMKQCWVLSRVVEDLAPRISAGTVAVAQLPSRPAHYSQKRRPKGV